MTEITRTGDMMLTALEAVVEHGPMQVADIAKCCSINRTVAHRLMTTLQMRGYVRRTAAGYLPGAKFFEIARRVGSDMLQFAMPFMAELSTRLGETVVLHEMDGNEAVVVGQAMSNNHVLRVQHKTGSRHSLARGASGLAILAFRSEVAIERILKDDPQAEAVTEKLTIVRQRGYAITHDELQLGVHGLAVPLHNASGEVDASLGLLFPTGRESALETHWELLQDYAVSIEASFGGCHVDPKSRT